MIYDTLISDTRIGDWIGQKLAQVLAFFGSSEAKASLDMQANFAKATAPVGSALPTVLTAPRGSRMAASIAGLPVATAAAAIARQPVSGAASTIARQPGTDAATTIARQPLPSAGPGRLGSGAFNINAPVVAPLSGKIAIEFTNAPPGMTVRQASAEGSRVAMNTNVGYRTLGTDTGF